MEHRHRQAVATTDATVTTIKTIPIKLNSVARVTAVVNGIRTGGSSGGLGDCASYFLTAAFKNSAGTAVQMGATTTIDAVEDQVAWDAAISLSGGTVIVTVAGAANNNITWNANIQVIENV